MSAAPGLGRLGFTSVSDFQRAWNLGPALVVDGIAGPKTNSALAVSLARNAAKQPDISPSFSASQFACHCNGRLPGCRHTLVIRPLLASLETLHQAIGRPVPIIDCYRCPAHNASIPGSASNSQHLYGAAVDIPTQLNLAYQYVSGLRIFAGIGYMERSHRVAHVDRRDVSGHNTTGGKVNAPSTWTYPEGHAA